MTSPASIPENVLRLMKPADRQRLGVMTSEEAMAAFVAKSERDIHKQIIDLLNLRGIAFARNRMDVKSTTTAGWPDFTLAVNGIATALEVKFEKRDLDPEQVECIAKMRANGWKVFVVRTLDEARAAIEDVGEGRV